MSGDCVEIRVECAERLTKLEGNVQHLVDNELKHIADDLKEIKGVMLKVIIAALTITGTALLGLIVALIKGHFQF